MVTLETIVSAVRVIQKQNGAGASTNEIKRYLSLGKSQHIKNDMKACIDKGLLASTNVGVGKNLYTITEKGAKRIKKEKVLIQKNHEIPFDPAPAKVKYKASGVTSALSGLTAVAGVIAENDLLERKLLLIRNQITKLLGVDDDGTSTAESDNDSAVEESDFQ
jgi:hypothetical protein